VTGIGRAFSSVPLVARFDDVEIRGTADGALAPLAAATDQTRAANFVNRTEIEGLAWKPAHALLFPRPMRGSDA